MSVSRAEKSLDRHIPTLLRMWHPKGNRLSFRELKDVSSSLLSLQRGLTGSRKLSGAGYMEDPLYLGSYLLYYWPVSFLQVYYAFESAEDSFASIVDEQNSINILDLGSGPGPASSALCDALTSINPRIKINVTLVDSSTKAVSLAARIIKSDYNNVSVNPVTFNFEKADLDFTDSFDIIIMSHTLNELWKNEKSPVDKRFEFIIKAGNLLKDKGILFLNEPAMLESSRNLISLRDRLTEKGYTILSPCCCTSNCPALRSGSNQTCHAEIMWNPIEPVASIAELAGLDRESVKMTYFILTRQFKGADSIADKEYRVVSDGMLNKSGRIRYLLCDGKNRIALSAKKGDDTASHKGFFNLARYDKVTVASPEMRGDCDNPSLGIVKETELKISKFR